MIPILIKFEPYTTATSKTKFGEVLLIVFMSILVVVDVISLIRYSIHKEFLYWIQVLIFTLNMVIVLLVIVLLLGYL